MSVNFNKAEFSFSAASRRDFPDDIIPRIVFTGKSNVGKSSVINALLNRKNIARVSSSPGKTIYVNFFDIDKKIWLVDLPGYGYSKTSYAEKERYSKLIDEYLANDIHNIRRFYMIVDARHKPTAMDETMMQWLKSLHAPVTIIANKIDKLKKSQIEPSMQLIRQTLEPEEGTQIIEFSALKQYNRNALIADVLHCTGYAQPEQNV